MNRIVDNDMLFNHLVRETALAIHYGRPVARIAAHLVQETGSKEQAYLIYMAAKVFLKMEVSS